jgi:hypothetical protein
VDEADGAADALAAAGRVADTVADCEKGELVDDADSHAEAVAAHETGAPWMSTQDWAAAVRREVQKRRRRAMRCAGRRGAVGGALGRGDLAVVRGERGSYYDLGRYSSQAFYFYYFFLLLLSCCYHE